ncbi:MAG TPA: phosphate ABC transporter permease subunit PstC [Terriglobales bacterium]|jgi:phosphate transport system permease protein|nr:phosphate ABC transporter permease subunit PstC [Terriglobales bacterium]
MATNSAAPRLVAPGGGAVFEARAGEITQSPSRAQQFLDRFFRGTCLVFAWLTIALVTFIILRIALSAVPAAQRYGIGFLSGRVWDPSTERYGIMAEIWGTLYTSVIALILGTAFGLAAAIFLSEGFLGHATFAILRHLGLHLKPVWNKLPDELESLLKNLIELLAAIPSVVYGLWGLFVVIPLIRPVCNWLHLKLGWVPLFATDLSGPGVLPAVIVLSIMILPTITAISRDALVSVPPKLRMAAYGLGATRWEAILAVIVPTALRGIFGGVVLAFGRALGETMALAMLVGNSNQITVSLFSPANTLAALLANNFPEAGAKQVSVLMYAALVLLGITLIVNVVGAVIIQRASLAHTD